MDLNGERRFYLYNDLRVVFPQRHSDADEGTVRTFFGFYSVFGLYLNEVLVLALWQLRVEHDFPDDPKYFDISN